MAALDPSDSNTPGDRSLIRRGRGARRILGLSTDRVQAVSFRWAVASFLCLPLLACGGLTAEKTAAQPSHHRNGGYQNNYIEFQSKGLGTLLGWKWAAIRDGLPPAPRAPTPEVTPNLAFIQANAGAGAAMQPAVTWIGHATTLVQMGGLNIITDPIFSQRASPLTWMGPKRMHPPGLVPSQLPHIDVVLVSHNHYDHCDKGSLLALNAQFGGPPAFIVPLGLKAWFNKAGISNVIELDWWGSHTLAGVDFVLTPVQHWSGRSFTDRLQTLWGGFAVFAPDLHLFFAGDTGYSKDFADIRRHFADRQSGRGFDMALIPIGAYEPRSLMSQEHADPDEAVRIHQDLQARQSIGVHWGTFALTDEAPDQPPLALAAARSKAGLTDDAFVVLSIGETRKLPRRLAGGAGRCTSSPCPPG